MTMKYEDLDIQETGGVAAIYITPRSEGVQPSISLEMVGGKKAFLRLWPETGTTEWSWTLHPTARLIFPNPEPEE